MEIEELLKSYYEISKKLEKYDQEKDIEEITEQILNIESEILLKFGLPESYRFLRILYDFSKSPICDAESMELAVKNLSDAAQEYLSQDALTDEQVLEHAIENQEDPFDVLPEIRVPVHDYTIFIFNEYLLTKLEKPTIIMEEFNKVTRYNLLDDIYLLENIKDYKKTESYKRVRSLKLKYIDEYLDAHYNHDEEDEDASPFGPDKDFMVLTGVIIEDIIFDESTVVNLSGLYPVNELNYTVTLLMDFQEFNNLMTMNGEFGKKITKAIARKLKQEKTSIIEIDLIKKFGKELVLDNIYLEAVVPRLEEPGEGGIQNPGNILYVNKVYSKNDYKRFQERGEYLEELNDYLELLHGAYVYYLRLKMKGVKEGEARRRAGLNDEILYKVALCVFKLNDESKLTE